MLYLKCMQTTAEKDTKLHPKITRQQIAHQRLSINITLKGGRGGFSYTDCLRRKLCCTISPRAHAAGRVSVAPLWRKSSRPAHARPVQGAPRHAIAHTVPRVVPLPLPVVVVPCAAMCAPLPSHQYWRTREAASIKSLHSIMF